jgi:hypothetical protein
MSSKPLHQDDSSDNPDLEPIAGHNRLPWLIGEIRSGHQAAIAAARNAVEHARDVGRLLIEAKAITGHGGWLGMLKEAGLSRSSAAGYMRLARLDSANVQRLSHLSLRLALRAIARRHRVSESDEEAELAETRARIKVEERDR